MYQPTLSRFQSLDPLSPNGVDLLDDNNWFGDRLTQMRNRYGYANNSPVNYFDPSGLFACNAAEEEEKEEACAGACFVGNKSTITKCEFTKVKVEDGSDRACYFVINSFTICLQLKTQFNAANKAAEDPKKYPTGEWKLNKCSDGCDCKKGYMVKKGPQKFDIVDKTIKSTGPIKGVGVTTCIVTVSGTVEVDGAGFALVECEESK